jgi:hypothetical protein
MRLLQPAVRMLKFPVGPYPPAFEVFFRISKAFGENAPCTVPSLGSPSECLGGVQARLSNGC